MSRRKEVKESNNQGALLCSERTVKELPRNKKRKTRQNKKLSWKQKREIMMITIKVENTRRMKKVIVSLRRVSFQLKRIHFIIPSVTFVLSKEEVTEDKTK